MKQTLKQQLFYQGKLFMHNNYIILLFVNIYSCNPGEKEKFLSTQDKLFFRLSLFSKPSFKFREKKCSPLTDSVYIELIRSSRYEMFYRNRFSTITGGLLKEVALENNYSSLAVKVVGRYVFFFVLHI